LWRVRGHLVSNRNFGGPKFFNSINSLCRIGRPTMRFAKLANGARNVQESPERTPYFSGCNSGIGTEQRVTVTIVGPCALGTETSSDRQPVR
jgi:uncharacterized protein (UPF0210 family)